MWILCNITRYLPNKNLHRKDNNFDPRKKREKMDNAINVRDLKMSHLCLLSKKIIYISFEMISSKNHIGYTYLFYHDNNDN